MFLLKKYHMVMSPDDGSGAGGGEGDKTKDLENQEQFKKLKTEKENFKKALDDQKAETARLAAELAVKNETELKTKEDYKTLSELKEAQSKEWETKFKTLETTLTEKETLIKTSQKKGAIKKELLANGVDEKSLDTVMRLVDVDSVKFDEDTNTFYGVDSVVKSLRETLPMAFGEIKKIPGGGSPSGPSESLSTDNFKNLSLKEMKEKQAELYKANGVTLTK